MLLRAAQSVPPDLSGRAGHDKQGEAVSLALGTILPVAPLHSYRPSLANTNWLGPRGGSQAVSLGQLPVLHLRPYAGNPVPVWVEIQIGFVGSPGDEENHVVALCCPSQSVMADGPVTFRLEEQHTWQLFSSIRGIWALAGIFGCGWMEFRERAALWHCWQRAIHAYASNTRLCFDVIPWATASGTSRQLSCCEWWVIRIWLGLLMVQTGTAVDPLSPDSWPAPGWPGQGIVWSAAWACTALEIPTLLPYILGTCWVTAVFTRTLVEVAKHTPEDGGEQAGAGQRKAAEAGGRDDGSHSISSIPAGDLANTGHNDPSQPPDQGEGDDRDKDQDDRPEKVRDGRPPRTLRNRKRRRSASPPPDRLTRTRLAPQVVVHSADFAIYKVGAGFRSSIPQSLEGMVAQLHSNPDVQSMCKQILENAASFIVPRRSQFGWGYVAERCIPDGTDICIYSGTLVPAKHGASNHCIDLGEHFGCKLAVDGTPADDTEPLRGLMQMVNHSCRPNCMAVHRDTSEGLGVLCLVTAREIRSGEEITFSYEGDFWNRGEPVRPGVGYVIVRCQCAGRACPNNLWRKERKPKLNVSDLPSIRTGRSMVRASLKEQSPPSLHINNHLGKDPLSATGLVGLVESEARKAELQGTSEAPLAGPVDHIETAGRNTELQGTSGVLSAVPVGKAEPERRNVEPHCTSETCLAGYGGGERSATGVPPSRLVPKGRFPETPDSHASRKAEKSEGPFVGSPSTSSVQRGSKPAQRGTDECNLGVSAAASDSSRRSAFLNLFKPWVPGTIVFYKRPRGGPTRTAEKGFPIWTVAGQPPQEAMFKAADQISQQAFYVAADQWSGPRLVKEFGAFESAEAFLNTLHRSAVRCYYEVIRADMPCKAYLDLEGEKGVLSREEGEAFLEATLDHWRELVRSRWPACEQECPRSMAALILDGSRQTTDGWKVSYHVIFPWLTFPRNDGTLKEIANELSSKEALHYHSRLGVKKPFVDENVYTKNRQFRTALSWKLDDKTTTGLSLRGGETDERLLQSFVTRVEDESWWAPDTTRRPIVRRTMTSHPRFVPRDETEQGLPEDLAGRLDSILDLLRLNEHPPGTLKHTSGRQFRWQAQGRPCLYAKIWRPEQPYHGSNGATITIEPNGEVYLRCLHSTCLRNGAGQGEHLGTLFEPRPLGVSSGGQYGSSGPEGVRGSEPEEPVEQPGSSQPGRRDRASKTFRQCLRGAMQQILRDDDGPFCQPVPLERAVGQPNPSSVPLAPRDLTELQRVRDWLLAPGNAGPPKVDVRKTLRQLVASIGEATNVDCRQQASGVGPQPQRTDGVGSGPQPEHGLVEWVCRPPEPWYAVPLGKRTGVGHTVLAEANSRFTSLMQQPDPAPPPSPRAIPYEWAADGIRVGALNVGLKGLAASCEGVSQLLFSSRCDILFLSDLRASRSNIGKSRRILETALLGEWKLLTTITKTPTRAKGMGVVVHSSLASQVCRVDLVQPPSLGEEEWTDAIGGRILHLQLNLQLVAKTWWIVGIYQHVAKPENALRRQRLLMCVAEIRQKASQRGFHLLIVGDANAAPKDGRWHCPPHSPLHASDALTLQWARDQDLIEVPRPRMIPTWRANLKRCGAVLDRAWYHPASLSIAKVHTRWAEVAHQFDHALIFVILPTSEAGTGFAGACRDGGQERSAPRLRVDMDTLKDRRDEFAAAVAEEVRAFQRAGPTENPFEALTAVNMIASQVALRIAPRAVGHRDCQLRQRPFSFRGHRALRREINWIHRARKVVKSVLDNDPAFMAGSERRTLWNLWVTRLTDLLRRSVVECPPALDGPLEAYWADEQKPILTHWLSLALDTIHSRQAIIRLAFDRAVDENLRKLRKRVRGRGAIDASMIQAALGKIPERPRIWGITGQVHIGAGLHCHSTTSKAVIERLQSMASTEALQRVEGTRDEIRIWFRGPRLLGDFLLEWSQLRISTTVRLLSAPPSYVAVMADDMLAMEEIYLARQGMHDTSRCKECRSGEVQPVATSARKQQSGCEWRAVRFLCLECGAMHDGVERGPDPPCPVPDEVWASMRRFPAGTQAFLSRPMDMESLDERIRKLPTGKAPGRDGIPYEFFKYGPLEMRNYLLAAANAFMSGSHPLPKDWLGGLVTLIPKTADAMTMKKFRPIANLSTSYKLCAAEIAERLSRSFEEAGVWHDCQEGGRRGRSTRRQIFRLAQMLEQGKRERATVVVVQLDFNTAFTSTNMNAVYRTLEAYGVPDADIELMKRMQAGSWYSVTNSFGETAACAIEKGMKQGDPTSPARFLTFMDPLLRALGASGCGWRPPPRRAAPELKCRAGSGAGMVMTSESDPSPAFVDDVLLLAMGREAIPEAQELLGIIEAWEPWGGVRVNLNKSLCAAFDYGTNGPVSTADITYKNVPLPALAADEPLDYLGMLIDLSLNYKREKDRVLQTTRERVAMLSKAHFLSPSQREMVVQLAIVSVFRYTAGLVPWSLSELEDLTAEWVRGYRGAWGLPKSTDDSFFRVGRGFGGRGCPSALSVWTSETASLISQCMRNPGVVGQLMVDDLQRACMSRGCQTLFQLQRMVRLIPPRVRKSRVELLMSRLDSVGLDVMDTPWSVPSPGKLLLSEVVWSQLWTAIQGQTRRVTRRIHRDCVRAVEKLATGGLWCAAQLSVGLGRWLNWRTGPDRLVTETEYGALLAVLQDSPHLEQIAKEREAMPGPRQLTLVEAWRGASVTPAAAPRSQSNGISYDSHGSDRRPDIGGPPRTHPWQHEPGLPDAVSIDCSNDAPDLLEAPPGWTLLRRNGRLLVRNPSGVTCQLEAAQAGMLELMNQGMDQVTFLENLVTACLKQQRRDSTRAVHWSRHFLACIARITKARGLLGCRAVTLHPHYWWFSSPDGTDEFGSLMDWPDEECVLLLDAYPPESRAAVLHRAFGHRAHVWILRLAERSEASTRDLKSLLALKAQRFALLPKGSLVLHDKECWTEARYDARGSKYPAEIWRLGRVDPRRALVSPASFQRALGDWDDRREDFHWPEEHPVAWDYFCERQQDAIQMEWDGVVAAIDGSVDRKTETMGAGFVVGVGPQPDDSCFFPVGGPLASLRAEAAGLDGLLDRVEPDRPLLVFTDCLILLMLLLRWGRVDFWPDPEDVKHFDVIGSCLQKLRKRTGRTRLVKVKSHSGLLMNDRADALAEQGRVCEEPPRWPAPRKPHQLCLSVRPSVRKIHPSLPDDNVSDTLLIRRAVERVELSAARMKGTAFSRLMLQDPANCGPVLETIGSMPDSTVRLWVQTVSGQYPTTARLHKMFPQKYRTATCPWCQLGVPETLGHFLSMCPKFREARTEAHNRCWRDILRVLERVSPASWKFFLDKPMSDTGLLGAQNRLGEGSAATTAMASQSGDNTGPNLLRLRPDAVAVNHELKKIAILEHCRPYDNVEEDGPSRPSRPPIFPLEGEDVSGEEPDVEEVENRVDDGGSDNSGRGSDATLENGEPFVDVKGLVSGPNRRSMCEAYARKKRKYQDLANSLSALFRSQGWKVQVLPWVVGTRGVLDADGISKAMVFMEVPEQRRKDLLRRTAVASVEALVFMHRVRKSGNLRVSVPVVANGNRVRLGGKRRAGEDAYQCMERWKRLATDPMRLNLQSRRGVG